MRGTLRKGERGKRRWFKGKGYGVAAYERKGDGGQGAGERETEGKEEKGE